MLASSGAESFPDQDTSLSGLPDFLEPVRADLAIATRFMRREERGPYTDRHSERSYPFSFFWEKDVQQTGDKLITSAARLLLQSDRTDKEVEAKELIDKCSKDVPGEDFSSLFLDIMSSTEVVTYLHGFFGNIITPITEVTQTPSRRFELTQLLARDVPYKDPYNARNPDEVDDTAFTLQALQAFGEAEGLAEPWPETEIQRGDFDSLIAQEVLEEAGRPELSSDSGSNRDADLEKMIRLAVLLSGKPRPTAITELSRRDALELWPETLKSTIEYRRANYIQALRANRSNRVDFLSSSHGILPKTVSQETVLLAARNFGREVAKQQSADTRFSARQRVQARARLESYGPRRRSTRQARRLGNTATHEADLENAEEDSFEQQIVYIDSNGNEVAQGSDEYRGFLNEYLHQFRGEPGLEEALNTMIAYIKKNEYSRTLPNGIRKMKGFGTTGLWRGERRFSKVYEFKPNDATGMSTSSERAKKTRIIFVRHENTIGLVAIADAGSMNALERKLGMKRAR